MSEKQNKNLSHVLKQLKENNKYDNVKETYNNVKPIKEDFNSYSTFSEVKKTEKQIKNE